LITPPPPSPYFLCPDVLNPSPPLFFFSFSPPKVFPNKADIGRPATTPPPSKNFPACFSLLSYCPGGPRKMGIFFRICSQPPCRFKPESKWGPPFFFPTRCRAPLPPPTCPLSLLFKNPPSQTDVTLLLTLQFRYQALLFLPPWAPPQDAIAFWVFLPRQSWGTQFPYSPPPPFEVCLFPVLYPL